ncbi:DUF3052 domain-containing protein [Acidipropionibacterium acidipropionici]|nr:hypothetical protein ASQ49_13685 [Acidipropionibacterium acidipropionici]AMS06970.1 hypothetical protein AXH35_03565 [Acidipropionibacterium acidipropionici]AOZ48152.1 hypothetical protein A8L58_05030 [Acidipropionibacterium acidipropionici]APZ10645.1 hypothetical protein BWX38_01195 [Acidipropionibacterium acidipropionici]AZP39413.1 DUF3052 domain-containing protein [Acidipropionibacterium acidipropionici]
MTRSRGFVDSATDFDKLGLRSGQVVQELGWDDDVDEDLRQQVMDAIEGDLIEDALGGVDVVWLWWRSDDGDVADGLVDAMRDLDKDGIIYLVTPKVGRPDTVDTSDLSEGVETAGMVLTSTFNVSGDWQAHKVVRPKGSPR